MRTKMVPAVLINTQNGGVRTSVQVEAYWDQGQEAWMPPKNVDRDGWRFAYCGRFPDKTPYYQTASRIGQLDSLF